MTFYARLVTETQSDRGTLLSIPFIQRGIAGRASRDEYIAFLGQAYHHVKHTVPLLMACGARLPAHLHWLQKAVAEYIEEEIGHEEWILNDIRTCGGDADAVRASNPDLAAELLVAYAYDTINRGNPVGFFGMVYVLEGTSIELATRAAASLQETLALPKQGFTYLNSHGALDIGHVDFFQSLMNRLQGSADQACVIHCAKVFFHLYGNIFRALGNIKESRP